MRKTRLPCFARAFLLTNWAQAACWGPWFFIMKGPEDTASEMWTFSWRARGSKDMIDIDCNFPGGNIIVEKVRGDTVFVRQDLRDTERFWFYWYFRVRGAAGRCLKFVFNEGNVMGAQGSGAGPDKSKVIQPDELVIGPRGPGVSTNGGTNWSWLGQTPIAMDQGHFVYAFPLDANETRFSVGMPYVQSDLGRFLAPYSGNPALRVS